MIAGKRGGGGTHHQQPKGAQLEGVDFRGGAFKGYLLSPPLSSFWLLLSKQLCPTKPLCHDVLPPQKPLKWDRGTEALKPWTKVKFSSFKLFLSDVESGKV